MESDRILSAVLRLDSWFDTMRAAAPRAGYGGPVAHWWKNNLQFTGAALDWRYEGIINAYLNLYRATNDRRWLEKAARAGDDLIAGQFPSGSYPDSSFEQNPYTSGRPHEAAVDIGLCALAAVLRAEGDPRWQRYAQTVQHNLYDYLIPRLWDESARSLRDARHLPSFVPNKAATFCEAVFLLADLTGDAAGIARYALPTLDAILKFQVQTGDLAGAIYQNQLNGVRVARFMPYYAARVVPAMLYGYAHTGRAVYVDAALQALRFCYRWRDPDGAFVQMIYPNGRVNRYPRWVAGAADIVRAGDLLKPHGFDGDSARSLTWILDGQHPNGGVGTARGFGSQSSQQAPGDLPEFRDILPVCGWADKAFRYLTGLIPANATLPTLETPDRADIECSLHGRPARYHEDRTVIELWQRDTLLYRWNKGEPWAAICTSALLWK